MILTGHDAEVLAWVKSQLPIDPYRVLAAIGTLDSHGVLVGGAVLHSWSECDIELSYYGPRTLTPSMVRALTAAARDAGVHRMTVRIRRSSRSMGRGLQALGFRWEGIQHRLYGPTKADDAILYGTMVADAARRFLPIMKRAA